MKIPPLFEGDFCVSRLLKMRKNVRLYELKIVQKLFACANKIYQKNHIYFDKKRLKIHTNRLIILIFLIFCIFKKCL